MGGEIRTYAGMDWNGARCNGGYVDGLSDMLSRGRLQVDIIPNSTQEFLDPTLFAPHTEGIRHTVDIVEP